MTYSGMFVSEVRARIFELFIRSTKLKFHEIEKSIGIRSNTLAYHLSMMIHDGILAKKNDCYVLTTKAETCLPVFSHIIGKTSAPVPVVVVALVHRARILLIKRKIRPYKGYWALVGGKILLQETVQEAALRIIRQKTGLEGRMISVNAVLHERVFSDQIVKHGFILFFVKAKITNLCALKATYGELKWFSLRILSHQKVVPSDLWLISNKQVSSSEIINAKMNERDGLLSDFCVE
ncbi:NUDIX domain-containing protein [Candidatus Woesearchaeota archaeon]|nr:NUDIX domain-containing protein [Candidatus Woesearchaeota archaeon]